MFKSGWSFIVRLWTHLEIPSTGPLPPTELWTSFPPEHPHWLGVELFFSIFLVFAEKIVEMFSVPWTCQGIRRFMIYLGPIPSLPMPHSPLPKIHIPHLPYDLIVTLPFREQFTRWWREQQQDPNPRLTDQESWVFIIVLFWSLLFSPYLRWRPPLGPAILIVWELTGWHFETSCPVSTRSLKEVQYMLGLPSIWKFKRREPHGGLRNLLDSKH